MASLAKLILDGEEIADGVDLGVKGYENMKFASGSDKVLEGNGWVVINKDNVDDFGF
jgi:simple sugar transport system substrate-binding protein